ncbi:hypothetical protein WA158_008430 [Blastocystis sp. Blastoise]
MPRDLEREALVDSSQFIEKGMITFFGRERNLHCSISQERLALYPDSWLYESWLKKNQAINGEFFTGFSERNLELIIAHMKGEHIDIDMKDNEEISILVDDFKALNVPLPLYLTERISKQKWNYGFKGIYAYITAINNDHSKQNSDLNSLSNSSNEQTVILNKILGLVDQLVSDNKNLKDDNAILKNDMKNIKDDNNIIKNDIINIKNDFKNIKDDHTTIKNDIKFIKNDNNIIKNDNTTIKNDIKNDNYAIKNDIKNIKDNCISLKNDIKNIKDDNISLKNDIKDIKNDNSTIKNDIKNIKNDNSTIKNDIKNDNPIIKNDIKNI